MDKQVSINEDQELFVIPCGNGFTCLGFDVLLDRAQRLANELDSGFNAERGTMTAYNQYQALLDMARSKNEMTGWQSTTGLSPQLITFKGKRVEVVDCYGDKRRFWVGESTGFIPCHLEIKRKDSIGGEAVYGTPFKSVRVVRHY